MAVSAGGKKKKHWLTVGEVSASCMVNSITVRRWIEEGKLTAIRLPSGHYRVGFADFRAFLERYAMPIPGWLEEDRSES
jgi:excisionase family DNA binding protein